MDLLRPFISIIIPTYERSSQLSECLSALARQDYPRDSFEVLVVDDGSSISPEPVVDAFRERLNVRYLRQQHAGPAAARNHGAAHAKGELLAFTDDDCMPAHGWLRSSAAGLEAHLDSVLGGRTVNALTDHVFSVASQLLIDYIYIQWNPNSEAASFFTSNNIALSSRCFRAVGGFDVGFLSAEDREFCDRVISSGYRLRYHPDAVVYHAHPLTFRTFWRQHFHYGRGAYAVHRIRARDKARRFCFEPLWFYLKMFVYPFERTRGREAACLVVLLAVAQAANAAGWIAAGLQSVAKQSDMF